MGIFSFISSIFEPATKMVDELHVSDEERGKLKNEFAKIREQMHSKSIELMKTEASSEHWIVASWRPLCALSLFTLILLDGFKVVEAPQQVYNLSEIFLTTYAGSRGLEKISRVMKGGK